MTTVETAGAKRRAAFALEIAKGLALGNDRRFWQAKLEIAGIGENGKPLALFASDNPEGITEVVDRSVSMALVNPAIMLTLAYRGVGPYKEPLPLRAIAIMPSYDLFAFVVTADTGLTSLEDVREKHFPLRISMRGQRNHSIYPVLDTVLAAAGMSLEDIYSWGGSLHYEGGFDNAERSGFESPARVEMAKNGTINAIFDEAVYRWFPQTLKAGMRALPLGENTVRNLEKLGFRRSVIDKASYPEMDADVDTIDFSGFAIFVRADAPDDLVTSICAGLDLRRSDIPWEGFGPLPVEAMVRDTTDGPRDIPLHPAAERYWHGLGYTTDPLPGTGRLHELRFERPPRIRSMITLEVASEILARAQATSAGAFATRIQLRQQTQDFEEWFATIVSGQGAEAELAAGTADVAVIDDDGTLAFRPGLPDDVRAAIDAATHLRKTAMQQKGKA
jgi:TRAP-type uncharacterized transport system substrate-binding protein